MESPSAPALREVFKVPSSVFEKLNTREKFKTFFTLELINDVASRIDKLSSADKSTGNTSPVTLEQQRLVHKALSNALELHIDQSPRTGGEPYVNHILRVARRLFEWGIADPEILITALLHDSLEDQASKLAAMISLEDADEKEKASAYLESEFGRSVAGMISALSNQELPEGIDEREKATIYREHVIFAARDPKVAVIKLSDLLDNALASEQLSNQARRTKLTSKYLPIIAFFIGRLQESDIEIAQDKKEKIGEDLKKLKEGMEQYISLQE